MERQMFALIGLLMVFTAIGMGFLWFAKLISFPFGLIAIIKLIGLILFIPNMSYL